MNLKLLGTSLAFALGLVSSSSAHAQITYHKGTTRKIMQLTGEYDYTLRKPTKTLTKSRYGLRGTDLGNPFVYKGNLWFTFGDSFRTRADGFEDWNRDFLGWTTAKTIEQLNAPNSLSMRTNSDGRFEYIDIANITEADYEVPSHAVQANGRLFVLQTTKVNGLEMRRSVMAEAVNDGDSYIHLYTLSNVGSNDDFTNTHFINASMKVVNAATTPGLPWSTGEVVLLYGTGKYRDSQVYLAAVPATQLDTKSAIRYYSNGPWALSESQATPLFPGTVGELSIGFIKQQNVYAIFYGGADDANVAGLVMRTSATPWGPWSAPVVISRLWEDTMFTKYIHLVDWENISEPNMGPGLDYPNIGGNIYAPGFIEMFTTGDAFNTQLYLTLSTWSPYQTVVVKTEIGAPEVPYPPTQSQQTLTLGDANWSKVNGNTTFYQRTTVGGLPGAMTWTAQGDNSTGLMWRWLPRNMFNEAIEFKISAGLGEVILIEGTQALPTTGDVTTIYNDIKRGVYGEVVEAAWGRNSNELVRDIKWNLRPYDRANLKLVFVDYSTAGWSFGAASDPVLKRNRPEPASFTSMKIMPGDNTWNKTPGTWFWNFTGGFNKPNITTYGPQAEANTGIMWRMLPRDWKNSLISFYYHGGGGKVLLIQGGDPIPVTGDMAAIQADILAGKYGKIIAQRTGVNSNSDSDFSLNLENQKSDDIKLVIIDAVTGPWGFIGVSEMSVVRFN